jgi:hypothetical protein
MTCALRFSPRPNRNPKPVWVAPALCSGAMLAGAAIDLSRPGGLAIMDVCGHVEGPLLSLILFHMQTLPWAHAAMATGHLACAAGGRSASERLLTGCRAIGGFVGMLLTMRAGEWILVVLLPHPGPVLRLLAMISGMWIFPAANQLATSLLSPVPSPPGGSRDLAHPPGAPPARLA